jgi:hypothetical protein
MNDHAGETRGERRERKLKRQRERMQVHGGGLRRAAPSAALRLARRYQQRVTKRQARTAAGKE